jgi:2-polyprenyl-3-methyl-5-hydroxy-6-metoxy-1,4-benzoquinol methylase
MVTPTTKEPLLTPWLRDLRISTAAPYLSGTVLDMGFGSGKLAARVTPQRYYGFDIDPAAPARARVLFPNHTFSNSLPEGRRFDCVVSLAVIEHTPDPAAFLGDCARFVADDGVVIITTPNPALEWLHGIASRVGLLSHEAHEDHQSVVGRDALTKAATAAGLKVEKFRYFMLGANQAMVLSRRTHA